MTIRTALAILLVTSASTSAAAQTSSAYAASLDAEAARPAVIARPSVFKVFAASSAASFVSLEAGSLLGGPHGPVMRDSEIRGNHVPSFVLSAAMNVGAAKLTGGHSWKYAVAGGVQGAVVSGIAFLAASYLPSSLGSHRGNVAAAVTQGMVSATVYYADRDR